MFAAVITYEHLQTTPSDVWVIVHNLGIKAPIVDCWIDISGDIVKLIPDKIVFIDVNTCNVEFDVPRIGTAIVA